MQVLAGWTALSGLQLNGNAGTLGGIDMCGDSGSVAGVVVPVNPGYIGKSIAVGNPPVDTIPAPDSVDIDWNGIVNGNVIEPTIVIPPGSFPPWSTFAADSNYYPIIRVNQSSWSLPNSGRGMIIATGDVTIQGSLTWHGVLLVGGKITSNGNNGGGSAGTDSVMAGATISGLNTKLGMVVDTSTANGNKKYQYDSCEVSKATTTMGALVTLRNTWVDNWVEY